MLAYLVLSAIALAPAKSSNLAISVTALPDGAVPVLHVEMTFDMGRASLTKLRLPSESFGQSRLFENVKELRVDGPAKVLADVADPSARVIRGHGRIRLSYDVVQRWTGSLPKSNEFHSGVIERTDFSQGGESMWVFPDWDVDQPRQIRIRWNLPAGWAFASSFGTGKKQRLTASLQELTDALYVGGDYRVRSLAVQGGPVTVALRGKDWKFSDEEFDALVWKAVAAERAFWEPGGRHKRFLALLVPTGDEEGTFHGLGRTNGFGLWLPHTTGLTAYLKATVAHEMMHAYTPGPMVHLDPPQWYWEGFTDYYAAVFCLREKLLSMDEYVGLFNDWLRDYYRSPARNLTEAEETKRRGESYDTFRLPYWRGMLLAANWDARIRAFSGGKRSLDDALKLAMKLARANKLPNGAAGIEAAIKSVYPPGVENDVERYITRGETIVPDPLACGPSFELYLKDFYAYDAGLDLAALARDHVVKGLVPGSAAAVAGLHEGDAVEVVKPILEGRAFVEAVLRVKSAPGPTVVHFYPRRSQATPQFRLKH